MLKDNILVIGQGGREHALAWKLSKSSRIQKVYVCPGNGGTSLEKNIINVDLDIKNYDLLIDFVKSNDINLTIVGPEDPLVNGLVNRFMEHDLKIFGPRQEFAILEGSKVFAKDFMLKNKIPTANHTMFDTLESAKNYLKNAKYPIVVKADGLAAGKGVIICENKEEADSAIDKLFNSTHSNSIVIEDFLRGQELSAIYVCSWNFLGKSQQFSLPWTKDYKSRDEHNSGPNTGGMGAVSHPLCFEHKNSSFKLHLAIEEVLNKTISGINKHNMKPKQLFNHEYQGFLYIGLMLDSKNNINVLEYNCRMGDPETQNLMLYLDNQEEDFYGFIKPPEPYVEAYPTFDGTLFDDTNVLKADDNLSDYCCTIVLAAKGYPGKHKKGFYIDISDIEESKTLKIFHAGTTIDDNKIKVTGGRILTVNVFEKNKNEAINSAYENIKKIKVFEDKGFKIQNQSLVFYRDDIGN